MTQHPDPGTLALALAARGLPIHPLRPNDKRPILDDWPELATTDPDTICGWFDHSGDRNIGVATGQAGNGGYLVVIDVDEHDPATSGADALDELSAELGILPDTPIVLTPSGGCHLYYTTPTPLRNGAGSNMPAGIDIRGAGGYVVAPGSTHPNGGRYEWEHDLGIDDVDIAPLPLAWLDRLSAERETTTSTRPTSSTWDNAPRPTNDRPGDAWAASVSWADLLNADGWQADGPSGDGGMAWIRPGKTRREGPGATTGYGGSDILKVFTSSAPPLQPEETYTKLGYLAATKFSGDFTNAVEHLRTLGYGAPPPSITPVDKRANELDHQAVDPATPWEDPDELDEGTRPQFPLDVLPAWMAAQAEQSATEMQLTPDLSAQLAITALSVITAGRVEVKVHGPWREQTNTYLVTALPPSAGKSPTFKMMLRPLDVWEAELAEEGAKAADDRNIDRQMAEKERADAVKQGDATRAKMASDDLRDLPPIHPPRLLADDATPEKLVDLLAQQDGRLALVSTEGGLFGMMLGKYGEKANLDVYLGAWSGDVIRVDRIERGSTVVSDPRLTIGLTVQHAVISELSKPELIGRGLTARFMYSIPADTVGHRDKMRASTYSDAIEAEYTHRLLSMARHLQDVTSVDTEALQLNPAALDAFLAWQAGRETRIGPYGPDRYMAEWIAKCDSTVVRLAGQLHLADANLDNDITEHTLRRALKVGDYWTAHAATAFDMMGADSDTGHARYLLGWLRHRQERTDAVSFRDLHQAAKKRCRLAADLYPAIDQLVDAGWLRADQEGRMAEKAGKGKGASPTFQVHPTLTDTHNPHMDPNTDHNATDSSDTVTDGLGVRVVRDVSPKHSLSLSLSTNTPEEKDAHELGLTDLTAPLPDLDAALLGPIDQAPTDSPPAIDDEPVCPF